MREMLNVRSLNERLQCKIALTQFLKLKALVQKGMIAHLKP